MCNFCYFLELGMYWLRKEMSPFGRHDEWEESNNL